MHHYTQLYNCLDRKADILKKFCVPVSTGTSKGNKLLKLPSDSISDGVIFQNIMRAMPPDSPSVGMQNACVFRTL